MNEMWTKTIGYDPYAGEGDTILDSSTMQETGEINQSAKGLFQLARLTGNTSNQMPGACKKCGQTGHLAFQCRNWMITKNKGPQEEAYESDDPDSDPDAQVDEDSSDDPDSDESSSSSSSEKKKKKKKKNKSAPLSPADPTLMRTEGGIYRIYTYMC